MAESEDNQETADKTADKQETAVEPHEFMVGSPAEWKQDEGGSALCARCGQPRKHDNHPWTAS